MLFGIDGDDGARITGWVTPDNPAARPAVIVSLPGGQRIRLEAAEDRPHLKASGLHRTGLCGFTVDEAACAPLACGGPLALYEFHGNTLIYRRATGPVAPFRLFHLETDPALTLAAELGPLFQLAYGSAELIGEETLVGIIGQAFAPSVLISGQPLYRRYERHLAKAGFRRSILLRDPLRVLAATILGMVELGREYGTGPGWRSLGRARLIRRFAGIDPTRARDLEAALAGLEVEDLQSLADPTVRRLAATDSLQPLEDGHVGIALQQLAGFDVIGFDGEPARFAAGLRALGRSEIALGSRPPAGRDVLEVEAALAESATARALIELDTELVTLARDALDRSRR